MKLKLSILFLLFVTFFSFSQENEDLPKKKSRKGQLYFYWGWNESSYSKSNIRFKGDGYNFTLHNVVGKDRQSDFGYDPYFKIDKITIPQYNFRLGYYFHNNYNVSIGIDHMKYVVKQGQTVTMSGEITNTGTVYDGVYNNDPVKIEGGFLQFEHTDGLNYINTELRRVDEIFAFNKVKINLTEGVGVGVLFPRTNTTLLNKERYDQFHVAGYGLDAVAGLNITLFKYFFIQSELKGGFINMPNIRTTMSKADKASQHFFFFQSNIVFGAVFPLF